MSYIRTNAPFLWFNIKESDVYVWSDGNGLHIHPAINTPGIMDDPIYPIEVAGRLMMREVGYHDATKLVIMLAKNAGVENWLREDIKSYTCPNCGKYLPRPDWEYAPNEGFFCDRCRRSFTKKRILKTYTNKP